MAGPTGDPPAAIEDPYAGMQPVPTPPDENMLHPVAFGQRELDGTPIPVYRNTQAHLKCRVQRPVIPKQCAKELCLAISGPLERGLLAPRPTHVPTGSKVVEPAAHSTLPSHTGYGRT